MNSRISRFVLPLVAVVVYIFLDLCYVFLARNRYAEVVKGIQRGAEMQFDAVAAVCCYILMAFGWYFIAVQLAKGYYSTLKHQATSMTPVAANVLSALLAGFLYGLVVYGVYNLTTRAIFNTLYPVSLLLQDLAWGTLFNTVYLTIYMVLWRKLTDPVDL